MSKLLKILGLGCTGGFSDSPDLQARFAAWIVFTCISIGGFVFDAWISESVFGDYLAYVGGSGRWPGIILSVCFAMAATSAVNVVAYAFVSYRRKSMLQESISDSLRFAGYVAGFLYLTFALVSLLANIQGADNAAERSAQAAAPVDDSQITAVTKKWTAEKEKAEARYDGELAKLNARIDAIEDGTSTEKAYDKNGKRGAVLWQGNKTPYGYALLEELNAAVTAKQAERTEALAALDDTYQKRLDAEQAAFNRTEAKYTDKKERSSTAIRMIVFLIYPIALLIAIFNAHFLYEATLYIKGEEDEEDDDTTAVAGSAAPAPMATPAPSAAPSPVTSTSPAKGKIGFRTGTENQEKKRKFPSIRKPLKWNFCRNFRNF